MRGITLFASSAICVSAWCGSCAFGQPPTTDQAGQQAEGAREARPKPEDVLKQMADYLGKLPAFSCRIAMGIQIQAEGLNQKVETKLTARLERPNRLALVAEGGMAAATIISDGKKLTQYMPALKRYTESDAPADIAGLAKTGAGELTGGVGGMIPANGDDFYKSIMAGVTGSEYLGTEKIGDVLCHHCRFLQQDINWEIWIEAGDRPVVHKLVPDLSKQFAGAGGGALGDAKIEYIVTFTDWNVTPKFTDADFAFTPPAGVEKVESLTQGMPPGMGGEEAAPHRLLGKAAPPFDTVDPNATAVALQNHLGKSVIMLDFWATWCGPCIRAMPEISGVAKKYADQGLVFYAVNVGEDADTVKEFLKAKEFDVPVAMDPASDISRLYGVTGIPQTVLVGKDGKVHVVHVGFGGNMAAELSKQVEDLLAGKDLATPALEAAEKGRKEKAVANNDPGTKGVKPAWTLPGQWNGVAADAASKTVYATDAANGAVSIDADGKIERGIEIGQAGTVRLANLAGDAVPELITFRTWGPSVKAFTAAGKALWEYPGGTGVDDVWAADVNGDGRDEVIIGYNGGTGLHVVDAGGKALWKFTDIGNVWHVTAGDFLGDREVEVVTTSAQGAVHVFGADGRKLKDFDVGIYANMVRMATLADGSHPAIVSGSGLGGDVMVCLNSEGEKKWSLALPGGDSNHVDDMAIATTPWAAVAMRGGLVHVVDLETGKFIAHVGEQGQRPQVAWLARAGQSPLLLVATGQDLNAFDVTPVKVDEAFDE